MFLKLFTNIYLVYISADLACFAIVKRKPLMRLFARNSEISFVEEKFNFLIALTVKFK